MAAPDNFSSFIASKEESGEKEPELYSVEFGLENSTVVPSSYKWGERVTRDNFCSMLIMSFIRSRGDAEKHIDEFYLLQKKTGFDYKKSYHNFIKMGGWRAFSNEEQRMFLAAYHKIKRHGSVSPNYSKDQLDILIMENFWMLSLGVDLETEEDILKRLNSKNTD